MPLDINHIRNFCIIAHIDHGKSTLADRMLELTQTLSKREMKHGQMLDTMELEQERGITIKLQPVRMAWKGYILNLIDTPGHVDFSYEVSRSLNACEGAILIVDATQGIQAQTLAHTQLAIEQGLTIIPVINKIDLPAADVPARIRELANTFGMMEREILSISAKEGTNVPAVLDAILERIPAPKPLPRVQHDELLALIFDSTYDSYRGVVAFVRLMNGDVKRGDTVYFLHTKKELQVLEVGYFKPKFKPADILYCGEIGYIITDCKTVRDARVGDTVWKGGMQSSLANAKPLPGYRNVLPFVFASIYPTSGEDFGALRDALEKLQLNDSALTFAPETSTALGHGFRCGFLGLLHLDIVQERLEREYDLSLIVTAPSVQFQIKKTNGEIITLSNPAFLPDAAHIAELREPWMRVEIITPKEYLGAIQELVKQRRGLFIETHFLEEHRALVDCELPLPAILVDFYDRLKTVSSGYASMNYRFLEYRPEDLVKLDVLVAGDRVDALSHIVHRKETYAIGLSMVQRLKRLIPRSQFEVAIQAAIGSRVIARETIPALRKDVTAKLYGGDRTRKDKLLKKQKEGKKRLKRVGKVEIPQEAFFSVLKR